MKGIPTRHIRIVVQGAVFGLWVALIHATRNPMDAWITQFLPNSLFLRLDPLVLTTVTGGLRMGLTFLLLGLATLAVSLLLGRVFCGWVCPLGTVFDVWGWILQRSQIRIQGPSPAWFRFKYYLCFAILIYAVLGVAHPFLGFDPLVILTRTAAGVLNPVFQGWRVIDWATLLLFAGILGATTRLSRIWCRTTCPLGAYLGIASRFSILRRNAEGCVQCNLCSRACPTGAIHFENNQFYNESECIKCFTCSEICPHDLNLFQLKPPLPASTDTYAPVSLERRKLIGTGAAALLSVPLLNLSAGEPRASKFLLRPPMSREEPDFLLSCIRCGECTKACPSGILKAAHLEHGLRALWTPVMVPTEGACLESCNACSQACPTHAILEYPIEEKYRYKAGTAILNSSLCISHTERKFCSECVRVCPTDAIEVVKGWEPETLPGATGPQGSDQPAPDGQLPTRPFAIRNEACIGCGACENSCDKIVFGDPALVTTAFGRATPSRIQPKKKESES